MKKLLLVLVCVVAMTAMASAQTPKPFSLYVGGLVSVPQSDNFSDAYNMGWHFSLGMGFNVMPSMQVVPKIEYHNFGFNHDDNQLSTTASVDGGNAKMWMFGGDARYSFGLPAAPLKPYVLGGLGFANTSVSDFESTDPLVTALNFNNESSTDLYWNLGAGVDFKTGPAWSIFGQLRYVSIATEGESSSFIPVTVGLKFF